MSLSELNLVARQMMSFAYADSSKRSLNSQQKSFVEFCEIHSLTDWPAKPDSLVVYAAYLIQSGRIKSRASIRQYLSAVRTLHKMYGMDCVTPGTYGPLDLIVKGIDRGFTEPSKTRLPITVQILCNLVHGLINYISHDSLEAKSFGLVMKSLYLTLFSTMLRGGNCLPDSQSDFYSVRHLSWGRIEVVDQGLVVRIPMSKTIQIGDRVHEIPIARCAVRQMCPVMALLDLVNLRGVATCGANDSVFTYLKNGSWLILTKAVAGKMLSRQLTAMGLNAKLYGLHSFRVGSIMQGLEGNNSMAFLRLHSDHRSSAIYGYLHMPAVRRFGVACSLSRDVASAAMAIGLN